MNNSLKGVFGLQTYADRLIIKSRYWSRKDGSKWWRNPATNSVEPFPEEKSPLAKPVVPKKELERFPSKAQEVVEGSTEFRNNLDNFESLDPQEQYRMIRLMNSPAHTVVAATSMGNVLGTGVLPELDLDEPLSKRLYREMLEASLPSDTTNAKEVLVDIFYEATNHIAEYVRGLFGQTAAEEFDGIVESIIPYFEASVAGKNGDNRFRAGDIDEDILKKGFMLFEEKFFDLVEKYINE